MAATSTPTSLWMNTIDRSTATSNSPRAAALRGYASPTRPNFEQSLGLTLELKKVLGTTVSSVNGFDSLADKACFATCAGSTAVLHRLEDGAVVSQRHFRARPNASSLSWDAPPSTPEWRGRQAGPVRPSAFGARATAVPGFDAIGSPMKSNAKPRTRAATSLSLSPDGRTLAVGETGHVPRILFFSLLDSTSNTDSPYATLSEHTFGIRCLAFSPDSRWLCSVGDIHDGFVFLWALNQRAVPKLHASNKCTSFVHDVTWLSTNSFVTVGTRHVKLWRTESLGPPSPSKSKFRPDLVDSAPTSPSGSKTLPGRNCLLGSFLENTFTSVQASNNGKAIVCSDKGDICLLDDTGPSTTFSRSRTVGFAIKCLTVDIARDMVWIGGANGELQTFTVQEIETASPSLSAVVLPSRRVSSVTTTGECLDAAAHSVALGIVGNRLVSVDRHHFVNIYDVAGGRNNRQETCLQKLRSHSSPVLGCAVLAQERSGTPRLVTWDSTGLLIFWTLSGEYLDSISIVLDQAAPGDDLERNELKTVKPHALGTFCVFGDKYGIVRVLHGPSWQTELIALKAHGSEVNDIAIATLEDAHEIVATCGRDRTVQVYNKSDGGLGLIQTIDHHASSVNNLLFLDEGRTLCSASSDRTIVIHTLVSTEDNRAFIAARILTTKQSPISIASWPNDPQALVVTTMDKQLHKYHLNSGLCSNTIRLTDEVQGPVTLAALTTRVIGSFPVPARLAFGISITDKSVRVHDMDSGNTVLKDYGHSEGLTSVMIIDEETRDTTTKIRLASTGLDGTVLLWEITNASRSTQETSPTIPLPETPNSHQQPLRRVLSRSAIAEFSKTLEANGISPLPSTSTARNHSPSRLRKKPSKYSFGRAAGLKNAMASPPSLRRPNRSPSPPSPVLPVVQQRKPLHRTKSIESFGTDMAYAADQLAKSMRTFRKNLSSTAETLSSETLKELEKEISLMTKAIGANARRRQSVSEMNVGDLLDDYSEKLAQIVQEKVNLGMAQGDSNTISSKVGVDKVSENLEAACRDQDGGIAK